MVSLTPLDQLALVAVAVDQMPLPSVGAAGLAPLASQVREFPKAILLRVIVTGLAVVLLNMKANSSNVVTARDVSGLV